MKKTFSILLQVLAFVSVVLMSSCNKENKRTELDSLALEESSLDMLVGETHQMTAKYLPSGVEVQLDWTVLDPNVATVDSQGKLEAVAPGKTAVVVSYYDLADTCDLSVSLYRLDGLKLMEDKLYLQVGESQQLNAEVTPDDAVYKLTWTSSDSKVITVDESGKVTAVGEGETDIIVSCDVFADTCHAWVTPVYDIDYTVMIYGCAGGNLDDFIISNMKDAARYGSTDKVKMTGLLKYSQHIYDYPYTVFYDLQGKEFQLSEYADKKFDLSDPDNLAGFIKKSAEMYPANNYILIITNHGSQWSPADDIPVDSRAMVFDDNNNYKGLSIYGLEEGISRSGVHMEVVYPDICLFGMLEFMNELEDVTNYVLASANNVPGSGGDYYHLLQHLNSGKDTETIMCDYMDDLRQFWQDFLEGWPSATDASFLRPSQIKNLYPILTKFKDRILEIQQDPESEKIYKKIIGNQTRAYFYDFGSGAPKSQCWDVDVLDIMKRLSNLTKDRVITECYEEMELALKDLLIKDFSDGHSGRVLSKDGFSMGVVWTMKGYYNVLGFERSYAPTKFNQGTGWDELLQANVD